MSLEETCLVLLRAFISRVFQLIRLKFFLLFCVFIIISQGCPLGILCRANLHANVGLLTRIKKDE